MLSAVAGPLLPGNQKEMCHLPHACSKRDFPLTFLFTVPQSSPLYAFAVWPHSPLWDTVAGCITCWTQHTLFLFLLHHLVQIWSHSNAYGAAWQPEFDRRLRQVKNVPQPPVFSTLTMPMWRGPKLFYLHTHYALINSFVPIFRKCWSGCYADLLVYIL